MEVLNVPNEAKLRVSRTFEAAHRLDRLPESHQCYRLHGHTYEMTLEIVGPVDEALGWVLDLDVVHAVLTELVWDQLDHRYLNEIPGLAVPTVENIARWAVKRLGVYGWPGEVRLSAFEVKEGATGGYVRLEVAL